MCQGKDTEQGSRGQAVSSSRSTDPKLPFPKDCGPEQGSLAPLQICSLLHKEPSFFCVSLQSQVRDFWRGSRPEQLLFLGIPTGTEREASFSRRRGLPRAVAVSSRDSGCTRLCGRDLGLEHVQGTPHHSLEPVGHLAWDACPHGDLPPGCECGWLQGWLQRHGRSVSSTMLTKARPPCSSAGPSTGVHPLPRCPPGLGGVLLVSAEPRRTGILTSGGLQGGEGLSQESDPACLWSQTPSAEAISSCAPAPGPHCGAPAPWEKVWTPPTRARVGALG